MRDARAQRTHALFVRALDVDESARDGFIAAECGSDTDLEARVRRLLAAVPRATQFLETPALRSRPCHVPELDDGPGAPPPLAIRGYRVLRVIGRGGMATVYEAEQTQPRRIVALKVMSVALANTGAVRRFEYETEVLARLRHPGIAQIYAAGTCEDAVGRSLPYFAMELVPEARTITQYAMSRGLGLRARVALLAEVCDAVQHGHQLGVIHRDLKPANILVDVSGRPKVIDFGVARPAEPQQAGLTQQADARQLIGTLTAMSPEQCTDGAAVDVRTDVYALGVVLYELVTGRLPLDLHQASQPEALRIITQTTPRRPSTLVPAARGDLDAVILMALEKEPARRYASAGALAADLRRHLDDQPIEARPAGALEQLRKFARRNRALVGGIAAVFVTLIAGVATTTRMTYVAEHARRAAETRERELEQVTAFQEDQLSGLDVRLMGERLKSALAAGMEAALAARAGAVAERERAELTRLLEDVNFTTIAAQSLDENLLQRSYAAIQEQFATQPLVQARLLHRLAGTRAILGLPERAAPVLEEALRLRREHLGEDHPDTLRSLHGLGALALALGQRDQAVARLREAYARSTRVGGPDDPATLNLGVSLGGALRQQGDLAAAEEIGCKTLAGLRRVQGDDHPATLSALNNVAIIYAVQGKLAEAEAAWRELHERRRRLAGEDHPSCLGTLANLAMVLQDQGKFDAARPLLERTLAGERRQKGDDHPDTLVSISNLASLLCEIEDFAGAEQLYGECVERRQRTLGPEHPSTLVARAALASVWQASGRAAAAEPALREVLAAQQRLLGDDHPDTLSTRLGIVEALLDLRRFDEAGAGAAAALAAAERMHPRGHWMIAQCRVELGQALAGGGTLAAAEAALTQGYDELRRSRGDAAAPTRAAAKALADYYALSARE
jgi:hypothetical protein